MLNTESRLASLVVWLAVAAIGACFLWSLLAWPTPRAVLARLLDSELAAFVQRNQVLLAGLLGFGGLAGAHLLNGWRDRSERRHAIERAQRRDGAVLAREARDIAAACERAARQLGARAASSPAAIAELRSALAPGDHMLLATPAGELGRLGEGASAAMRAARAGVRRLAEAIEAAGRDEAAGARAVAARAAEACLAARHAARVLEALARSGPAAADRLRLLPMPEDAEIDHWLASDDGAAKASRLQSAA